MGYYTTDIYTDGAARGNGYAGSRAGIGVYFGPNDRRNVSERLAGDRQTNQRAELAAIGRALDLVSDWDNVRIHTDSQYAINCLTEWGDRWDHGGWWTSSGGPVQNQDLIRPIRDQIEPRSGTTELNWVRGHSKCDGNIEADQLAVDGAYESD